MGRESTAVLGTVLALGVLAVVPLVVRSGDKPAPLLAADEPSSPKRR